MVVTEQHTAYSYNTFNMSTQDPTTSPPPIHVATVNVRYDGRRNNPVPIPPLGAVDAPRRRPGESPYREQPWAVRRSRLVDALLSTGELDIVGFQEVYYSQLLDLGALLGPRFANVGVGRDDGKRAGEYSPIFYDKDRFELVDWKTVWLSKTPDVPGSVGWDASQTRIATLLSLKDRRGGTFVHAVCTHYDDQGVRARGESSLLIRRAIREWVDGVEANAGLASMKLAPVILFGDFNSPAEEDGYKNITADKPLAGGVSSFTFLDAYVNLRARGPNQLGVQSRPYGPNKTYTGFDAPGRTTTTRIDFIMLAAEDNPSLAEAAPSSSTRSAPAEGRGGWRFTQYAVLDNWVEESDADGWEGRWSDHRAVKVTVERD